MKKIPKEKILHCKACGTVFKYTQSLAEHIKNTKVTIKKIDK